MAKIRIYGGGMTRFSKEIIEAGFAPGTEAEILKNALGKNTTKGGTYGSE